ncbi:MAG: hypothetical protein QOJ07_3357, partial [Thermoleophilaceae bacterium]|nr:hypothetical protein [Thermoleophilaceae bacterium]
MALHDTCSDRIFDVFVQSGPAAALGALPGSGGSRETWIRGAALGALGRYGRARSALEGLAADRGVHGSLAASTLASHLRQLGRHGDAREFDERALATAERLGDGGGAPGVDTPADALFDARLGLAADAVGLADVPAARSWLAAAGDDRALWRRDVRLGWVGTEIA